MTEHRGAIPGMTSGGFRPPRTPQDQISAVPLVELVDRLLNRGVVLTGELTISVAGVDLIYLGLSVVLTGVETMRRAGAKI